MTDKTKWESLVAGAGCPLSVEIPRGWTADGNVPVVKAKRVRKPKAVAEQAATEAAS